MCSGWSSVCRVWSIGRSFKFASNSSLDDLVASHRARIASWLATLWVAHPIAVDTMARLVRTISQRFGTASPSCSRGRGSRISLTREALYAKRIRETQPLATDGISRALSFRENQQLAFPYAQPNGEPLRQDNGEGMVAGNEAGQASLPAAGPAR
jgi:hypothetical protein